MIVFVGWEKVKLGQNGVFFFFLRSFPMRLFPSSLLSHVFFFFFSWSGAGGRLGYWQGRSKSEPQDDL